MYLCTHKVGLCHVFPLLHPLKLYKQILSKPMMGAASLTQLDDISPLPCIGLLLSRGFSSQPLQRQPTATNSHSVSCLSTSEATEGLHSQPRSYSQSNWVNKHAKRDPCWDTDKPSTKTHKYINLD